MPKIVAAYIHFLGVKSKERWSYNLQADSRRKNKIAAEIYISGRAVVRAGGRNCDYRIKKGAAAFEIESDGRCDSLALARDFYTLQAKIV